FNNPGGTSTVQDGLAIQDHNGYSDAVASAQAFHSSFVQRSGQDHDVREEEPSPRRFCSPPLPHRQLSMLHGSFARCRECFHWPGSETISSEQRRASRPASASAGLVSETSTSTAYTMASCASVGGG